MTIYAYWCLRCRSTLTLPVHTAGGLVCTMCAGVTIPGRTDHVPGRLAPLGVLGDAQG